MINQANSRLFLEVIEEVARNRGLTASAATLAEQVRKVSQVYTRHRDAVADLPSQAGARQARLRFFLPRDVVKVIGPIEELVAAKALPSRPLRVLDLGAGLGATSLGLALIAKQLSIEVGEILAVDRDPEALSLLEAVFKGCARRGLVNGELKTRVSDATARLPRGRFDLVLAGLVINELCQGDTEDEVDRIAAELDRWSTAIVDDGAIVVIEPALRSTTRFLQHVRDRLQERGTLSVFAPCVRSGPCPMLERPKDWCHADRAFALPEPLATVARTAGLRFERSTYAYLTLRRDDRCVAEAFEAPPGQLYRVVSHPLPSKGKLELVVCGDVGTPRLMRLRRHRSDRNRGVDEAERGSILWVEESPDPSRIRVNDTTRVDKLL